MANALVSVLVEVKDGATSVFSGILNQFGNLTNAVFSFKSILEEVFASEVVEGITTVVQAFAGEELAITRLNSVLRVTGRYTDDASASIQQMAKYIQDTTTVSRLAAIDISATIGQVAKQLSTDQLAESQKLAVGLSAWTQGRLSVESAAVLIGKALEGSTNALQRYGIYLDTTASQQDKFNSLAAQMTPLFTVAQESTKSLSGEIAQAANAWADLQRTVGEVIVDLLHLESGGKTLKDVIVDINNWVKENAGQIVKWGQDLFAAVQLAISAFQVFFKLVVDGAKDVLSDLRGVFYGIKAVGDQAIGNIPGAIENGKKAWDEFNAPVKLDLKAIAQGVVDLTAAWDKFTAKLREPPPKIKLGASKAGSGANFAGGDDVDIHPEVLATTESVKVLDDQFKAGTESAAGFLSQVVGLRDKLQQLMQVATGKDLDLLERAFTTLGKTAAEAVASLAPNLQQYWVFWTSLNDLKPQDQATAFDGAVRALTASFKEGAITGQQYLDFLVPLRERMTALAASGKLSAQELTQLLAALKVLGSAGAEAAVGIYAADHNLAQFQANLSKLSAGDQVTAVVLAVKNLQAAIASHTITANEGSVAAQQLMDIIDKVGKSAGLTAEQITKLKEALKQLNEDTPQGKFMDFLQTVQKGMEDTFVKAVGDALNAHKHFGETIEKEVQKAAVSYSKLAFGRSLMEFAEGLAAVFTNPGAAGGHFAAAAEFAAAGTALALVGGAGGGWAANSGGGAASNANAQTDAVSNLAQGNVTINVPNTFTSDPTFWDALIGGLEQAGLKRITVTSQG